MKNFSDKTSVPLFQIRREQHWHRPWVTFLLCQVENERVLPTPPNLILDMSDVHEGSRLRVCKLRRTMD